MFTKAKFLSESFKQHPTIRKAMLLIAVLIVVTNGAAIFALQFYFDYVAEHFQIGIAQNSLGFASFLTAMGLFAYFQLYYFTNKLVSCSVVRNEK